MIIPSRKRDTVIGPIVFTGLPQAYRDLASRPRQWQPYADVKMPALKIIALLRSGVRVTLKVPPEERSWLRLIYLPPLRRGVDAITLQACDRLRSRRAQRRECGWGVKRAGTIRFPACQSDYTQFSGGFGVDFAQAPKRALCAKLLVWVQDERRPVLKPLFKPRTSDCDDSP